MNKNTSKTILSGSTHRILILFDIERGQFLLSFLNLLYFIYPLVEVEDPCVNTH